jgi:predicted small lipoprotein YifL
LKKRLDHVKRIPLLLLLTIFVIAVLAGCGLKPPVTTQPNASNAPNIEKPTQPASKPETKAQASSGTTSSVPSDPPVKTASNKKNERKPSTEDLHQITQSLMGIQIDHTKNEVLKLYGQPVKETVWEEEDLSLLVFDYESFTVGFHASGKVEFVSLYSRTEDPKLNGLMLGMSTKDALQSLGDPDTNSTYVWTYQNAHSILKLDIDPKLDVIHSIKLFRSAH